MGGIEKTEANRWGGDKEREKESGRERENRREGRVKQERERGECTQHHSCYAGQT